MLAFTSAELKLFSGPGVYPFWRGDTCVYVGATIYGLGRPFGPAHHIMRKYSDLHFTFEPMETGKAAFELEETLILDLAPEYNVGAPYGKEFRRRYQARYRAAHEEERKIREMLRANFGPHPDGRY